MNPEITCIIPTFNRAKWLPRAVHSVLRQTHAHVKVCIYDNASTDDTEKVMREWTRLNKRIHYFRHSTNIGPYANFNYGMQDVTTPFFSFLADDDMMEPTFYARALAEFAKSPQAWYVCMPTIVVNEQLHVISPPVPVAKSHYAPANTLQDAMAQVAVPNTWTGCLFRSIVRNAVGSIDLLAGSHADGVFMQTVAKHCPGVIAPGVGAVLVAHRTSLCQHTDKISVKIGTYRIGRALVEKRWDEAHQTLTALRKHGYTRTARGLGWLTVWSQQYVGMACLYAIWQVRQWWKALHFWWWHRQYGHLVAFTKELTHV